MLAGIGGVLGAAVALGLSAVVTIENVTPVVEPYSVFLALGQITGALIGGVAADWLGIDGMFIATLILLAIAIIPLSQLRAQEHQLDQGDPGLVDGRLPP